VEYVALCDTCQRVKAEHQRPVRLLQPLKIPEWKWEEIGMDFIVGLPCTQTGYDSIWVIVDRLTKLAHFILVKTSYSGADEDITHLDTNNNPPLNVQGPITRARARQLNLEVSSFLNSSSYDYENRLLPNDYIVLRNHGEGQGILGEGLGGVEDQQGHTSQEGGPNQLTSGLFFGSRSSLL
jgi:hypothetical protein